MVLVNTGLRRAIGAGINKGLSFFAPLKTQITLARGTGSPTYTRATTAYVTDFEGLLKPVPSGCARFSGARFVRNDFLASNDLTSAVWVLVGGATKAAGSVTFSASAADIVSQITNKFSAGTGTANKTVCVSMTVAVASGTGQFRIYNTHSAVAVYVSPDLTATTTPQRFSFTKTFGAGVGNGEVNAGIQNGTGAAAATFLVSNLQVEDVTGQVNTACSEYVSVGVLSAPYHGAGVDGVKYFDTENGDTVASNVVTEATGAVIADATLDGYLVEGQRQNRCLYAQDFTNPVWVSGGGGIAVTPNTAVAPDGTTTADTLTASGANGTLIQDLGVVASAAKAGGLFLKRKTGTGNIDLTLDGGATWTTVAVTSSWLLLEKTQTLADEDFGIRIVTSGDAVYAWQAQVETAAFISSVIPTTTAAVTRNASVISYPSSGNIAAAAGTIYLEFTPQHSPIGTIALFGTYVDANNYTAILHDATNLIFRKRIAATNYDATIANAFVAGTTYKVAASWGSGGTSIVLGGTVGTPHANAASAQIGTTIQIGADGNGAQQPFASIKNPKIWQTAKTDAQLQALTT